MTDMILIGSILCFLSLVPLMGAFTVQRRAKKVGIIYPHETTAKDDLLEMRDKAVHYYTRMWQLTLFSNAALFVIGVFLVVGPVAAIICLIVEFLTLCNRHARTPFLGESPDPLERIEAHLARLLRLYDSPQVADGSDGMIPYIEQIMREYGIVGSERGLFLDYLSKRNDLIGIAAMKIRGE